MADKPDVHTGKIIPAGKGGVNALDGFAALNKIVGATRDCINTHEIESTKRAEISVYETVEVARIRAAESVLKDYFAQVFAERRGLYEELFLRLDMALEEGNNDALHSVVTGIVDIAKVSPLAAVGDLAQVRAALDDPDHEWDLG